MKPKLYFSPQARADLASIFQYIAHDNRIRAASYVKEIRQACRRLCDFPKSGVRRFDLREGVYTLALWGKIVVAYRLPKGEVEILRVFSAGRDFEAIIRDERADD